MIKLNFEFDSKDSVSSQLYDWLSACPLEQSCLKITTTVDYIDPKTKKNHCIGNIILDMSPEEMTNVPSTSQKGVLEPKDETETKSKSKAKVKKTKAKTEPIISGQKVDSLKETPSKAVITDQKNEPSETATTDQKDHPSQVVLVNKAPAVPESSMIPKAKLSFDTTFESGFDESILAAVAFIDIDDTSDNNQDKDKDKSEKQQSVPKSTEEEKPAPVSEHPVPNATPVSVRDEDIGSEDYDFLLNSLDEFNA